MDGIDGPVAERSNVTPQVRSILVSTSSPPVQPPGLVSYTCPPSSQIQMPLASIPLCSPVVVNPTTPLEEALVLLEALSVAA